MKIILSGLMTNYQDFGKGESVLLLHGWTNDARLSFTELGRALSGNYRVVIPDLPGFGESSLPPDNWGIPEYAEFVNAFIKKIELKPDYVIAHSNGGTIALYALGEKLLAPKKLVLLGSAGIRAEATFKKTILKIAAKPVKLALSPLPKHVQERLKKRAYGTIGSDLYVIEHMKPIFKRTVDFDIQDSAKKVAQPSLLIYGAHDTSTPVRYGKIFENIMPQASLKIIPSAGHYVHIDQPTQTITLIKGFLK